MIKSIIIYDLSREKRIFSHIKSSHSPRFSFRSQFVIQYEESGCTPPTPAAYPRFLSSATPAHVIDPKYPGAFEQLIDLSSCWDEHKLFESRQDIMALAAKISRCHEHSCRFLGAAQSLIGDTYRIALDATSVIKTVKAAGRIAMAEFKGGPDGRGRESVRFLSAVTNKGLTIFDETARTICERVYLIEDPYGAASRLLLTSLRSQALEAGWNIITCYCPLSPFEKLEHLFIPELKLGFMTANDYHKRISSLTKLSAPAASPIRNSSKNPVNGSHSTRKPPRRCSTRRPGCLPKRKNSMTSSKIIMWTPWILTR